MENYGIFNFQLSVISYFSGLECHDFSSCLGTAKMRERRKSFCVEWNSPAKIYDRNGRFAGSCIVSNFSNGGAKIVGVVPSEVPDEFILQISPHSRPQESHVIRRSKDGLGVEFPATTEVRTSQKYVGGEKLKEGKGLPRQSDRVRPQLRPT